MLSNFNSEGIENSIDNAFRGIPVGQQERSYILQFLTSKDYSGYTIRAILFDLKKFLQYFTTANQEPYDSQRVTAMDMMGFRNDLRQKRQQAVSTVNRALVSVRRYMDWLADQGVLKANVGKAVKELKRQRPVPKGLERAEVRKLMREIELRHDIRSQAIFSLFLHTGCRVSDLVQVQIQDICISDRSGSVVYRNGKGNKERTVPLPLVTRNALTQYLEIRPPISSNIVFAGERGVLTDKGIRALCRKYSAICGFKIHPHLLRHTFAKSYLQNTNNDLVGLAQILGHNDINTTRIYCEKGLDKVAEQVEKVEY